MLIVPAALALVPKSWIDRAVASLMGWNAELSRSALMLLLFVLLTLAFLLVRLLLTNMTLRLALTPGRTKTRRVHRRAVELFRAGCELKTRGRTGILIYLSLGERRAEILADKAIADKSSPRSGAKPMAALVDEVKAGRPGGDGQGRGARRRRPRPLPAARRRQSQRAARPAGGAVSAGRPKQKRPRRSSGRGASSPPGGAANGNMCRAPAASARR